MGIVKIGNRGNKGNMVKMENDHETIGQLNNRTIEQLNH